MLLHLHRVVWEQTHGPIPEGMHLHHRCERKGCVRLDHLQLVTPKEHRAIHGITENHPAAKRRAWTHCVHGHEFNAANTIVRLNGTRFCRASTPSAEYRL